MAYTVFEVSEVSSAGDYGACIPIYHNQTIQWVQNISHTLVMVNFRLSVVRVSLLFLFLGHPV